MEQSSIKRIENKLRESEKLHRLTLSNISDAVFITDDEGNFTFICPNVSNIFGYNWKEVNQMKNIKYLLGESLFSQDHLNLKKEISNIERKVKDKSNELHHLLITVKLVRIKNGTILYSCRDITERKIIEDKLKIAKEKAEEASKVKSNFISIMSHELKTPLIPIITLSDHLLHENKYPEIKKFIQMIYDGGRFLLDIINDILYYIRIDSNQLKVNLQIIDIKDLVDEVIEGVEEKTKAKGLQIDTCFETESDCMLKTDGDSLKKILNNLLDNAIKFTKQGSIKVEVKSNENCLDIYIQDTGIGLEDSQIESIFEPFYQVDNSPTRRFQGIGLGLSISKKLALLLGGDLKVEKSNDQGCIFHLVVCCEPLSV